MFKRRRSQAKVILASKHSHYTPVRRSLELEMILHSSKSLFLSKKELREGLNQMSNDSLPNIK